MNMIEPRTWEEFRGAGLLWWINRTLHLFGWAIVVEVEDDTGDIVKVYPARCKFRGFHEENESEGFERLTAYLSRHVTHMVGDIEEGHS